MKHFRIQYSGKNDLLFSDRDLLRLILPLLLEQLLSLAVGLADSMIVAVLGEAAISGVSLIDFILQMMIMLFNALATGGAVVVGQYLGAGAPDRAASAARHLLSFSLALALLFTLLLYGFYRGLITLIFGGIEADVYASAREYFLYVAASIPFLAIYSAKAAVLRVHGDSRTPMLIMLGMNLLNVLGNLFLILALHMGTAGVAIPTLLSRFGAAALIVLISRRRIPASDGALTRRFDGPMLRRILGVGVPYGLENGLFYLGRLLVLSLVSTLGTAAIAANSVGQAISGFQNIAGTAIGLGMTTVVSQCIGLNDSEQARYYIKKLMAAAYAVQFAVCMGTVLSIPLLLRIYKLSSDAAVLVRWIVVSHGLMMLIWPLSNTLPSAFRAAGDARFPMTVSIITMICCRLALAYVLCLALGMGLYGTWAAMYLDWAVKTVIFVRRYHNGKWLKHRIV